MGGLIAYIDLCLATRPWKQLKKEWNRKQFIIHHNVQDKLYYII